jgi:hypothetical protein
MFVSLSSFVRRLALAAAFAGSATLATTAHAQATVSGSGARGGVSQSLNFGGTVALLNAFDFDFGLGNDHHLRRIAVMPTESQSTVSLVYSDKNGDDAFAWRAGFHGVSNAQIITNELSGVCRGGCTTSLPLPAGYTFVVRGFDLAYLDDDHHVRTVGVEHGSGTLRVYLADQNGDDEFSWRVRYALVPNALLGASANAAGSGVGAAQAAITAGRTVLRGFMFSFGSADHHVSRVAVRPSAGNLALQFHDQNADDSFSWRVQWVNLR